jgi:hypothetical protein
MPRLENFKVSLKLPYIGGIEGTWKPNEAEKKAAWEMYVELVTRAAVVELGPDEGTLREALSSMHSLFSTTRKILRDHGPSIARPRGNSQRNTLSFGYLAVAILNTVLRPLLAKWHPLLRDYEDTRQSSVSSVEHERRWEKYAELRREIANVRVPLMEYANLLAQVAQVPSLITDRSM